MVDSLSHGHSEPSPMSTSVNGVFKNYNTIEEFKAADKTALFNAEGDKVRIYFFLLKVCN
jgi:hypothetical protein